MITDEIKNVGYVGAGTMGCYNSIVASLAGYDTVLWDASANPMPSIIYLIITEPIDIIPNDYKSLEIPNRHLRS